MTASDTKARKHAIRPLRALSEGLAAGLLAALVVAAVHFVHDVIVSTPLHTPSVLGALFFDGVAAAEIVRPSVEATARFTVLHVTLWLVAGALSSYVMSLADSRPGLWPWIFAAGTFAWVTILYASGAFAISGLEPLHLWMGTIAGAATTTIFLARRHPRLLGRIRRQGITRLMRGHLVAALEAESRALASYRAAAERFPEIEAFGEAREIKRGHVAALDALRERFDLRGNAQPETPPRPGDTPAASLEQALAMERALIAMYDRFLASPDELGLNSVFLRHRYAAFDGTLPALEKSLADHQEK